MRAFSPGETHHQYPGNAQHHVVPSAGSTLQTISSLPTGMSLTSIQAQALAARHDLTGTWESTELESAVDQSDHVTARPSHGGKKRLTHSLLHGFNIMELDLQMFTALYISMYISKPSATRTCLFSVRGYVGAVNIEMLVLQ